MKRSVKCAFSLVELLVALIAISCIIAAFAPVMTKKMKHEIGLKGKTNDNFKLYLTSTQGGTYDSLNNNYSFTFKVPQGVTKLHAVLVGAGSGGAGATPGQLIGQEVSTDCVMSGGKYVSTPKTFTVAEGMENVTLETISGGGGGGNTGYFSDTKMGCKTTLPAGYTCSQGKLVNGNQCLVSAKATCSMVNGGTIYGTPILTKEEIAQYGSNGDLYPYNIWVPYCGAKADMTSSSSLCATNSGSASCTSSLDIYYLTAATKGEATENITDAVDIGGSKKCIKSGKTTCSMVNGGTIYGTPILTKEEIFQYSTYIYPYETAWVPYCGAKVDMTSSTSQCATSAGTLSCTSSLAVYYFTDAETVSAVAAFGGGGGGSGAYANNSTISVSSCKLPKLNVGDTIAMRAGAGGAGTGASGEDTQVTVSSGGKYYVYTADGGLGGKAATATSAGAGGTSGSAVRCTGAISGYIPRSAGAPGESGANNAAGKGGVIGGASGTGGDGGFKISNSQVSAVLNGKPGQCGKVTVKYGKMYDGAAGGGGGSGGIVYVKSIPVTPGQTCTVTVGKGGSGGSPGSEGGSAGRSTITCSSYVVKTGATRGGRLGSVQTDAAESDAAKFARQGKAPNGYWENEFTNKTSFDVIKTVQSKQNDNSNDKMKPSGYGYESYYIPADGYSINDATFVTKGSDIGDAIGGNGMRSPMDNSKYVCAGLNQGGGGFTCSNAQPDASPAMRFRIPDILGDVDYGMAGAAGAGGGWKKEGNVAGSGSDGQDGYVYVFWDKQ